MEDGYTIQISSNLVSRLVSDAEQPKKNNTRKVKPKTRKTDPLRPTKPTLPHRTIPLSTTKPVQLQHSTFSSAQPLAPPPNAELEAIRSVLCESEKVLERLEKHEANMAGELTQLAKDLHEKEFKLPYRKPLQCLAEKEACLECYKENSKDPLKCRALVKAFATCSQQAQKLGAVQAEHDG